MSNTGWRGTGVKIPVPADALNGSRLDRVQASLRPGQHLWISITVHRVYPDRMDQPGAVTHLDMENLLQAGAIGCYVCEQPWREGKGRDCPGSTGAG